jgi:hypothetical protein
MTNDEKLMRLALEALETCEEDWIPDGEWETRVDQYDHDKVYKARNALISRLANIEYK